MADMVKVMQLYRRGENPRRIAIEVGLSVWRVREIIRIKKETLDDCLANMAKQGMAPRYWTLLVASRLVSVSGLALLLGYSVQHVNQVVLEEQAKKLKYSGKKEEGL